MHCVVVVSMLNFEPEGWWFELGLCHHVVFSDKKLCSTQSFSTQVYKWVLATYTWGGGGGGGNLAMDFHPIKGE